MKLPNTVTEPLVSWHQGTVSSVLAADGSADDTVQLSSQVTAGELKAAVSREGVVEAVKEPMEGTTHTTVIASGAFRREENIAEFGSAVVLGPNGECGYLAGPFAKMGKCKVVFPEGYFSPIGSSLSFRMDEKYHPEGTHMKVIK